MSRKSLFQLNLDKAEQARKKLEADPHFQEAILDIQSKYRILKNDPEREENLSKHPEVKTFRFRPGHPRGKLFSLGHIIKRGTPIYKDVVKILKQFHLGECWFGSISRYVLCNKFNHGLIGINEAEAEPDIIEDKDPISGLPTISIRLGRNTTLEDIKELWPVIRVKQGFKDDDYEEEPTRTKFSYQKNFVRDYYIFKLYRATGRKLNNEILGLIWNQVKSKYNQDLDYGNIKKIVSVMKKEFDKKPLK